VIRRGSDWFERGKAHHRCALPLLARRRRRPHGVQKPHEPFWQGGMAHPPSWHAGSSQRSLLDRLCAATTLNSLRRSVLWQCGHSGCSDPRSNNSNDA